MKTSPNDLIHESSPYLLQHAYNPVKWKAWNQETLDLAKREEKILLISVGYSACHWCHVMERECFEDPALAEIMNDNFICIKVDREERPDIDQVYMLAVQLMTGRGGWPLNCFALPDGKPFYGGTYFPPQQWQNVLLNIADLWNHEKDKIYDYAEKLSQGMQISEIAQANDDSIASKDVIDNTVKEWIMRSDKKNGGPDRAPKFPLPVNYNFLLHYNHYKKNIEVEKHIRLTLDSIANGGIYDQIGGGFARYSTDSIWKAPHFEKMLYDNAQLISLYAKASLVYNEPRYLEIAEQTCDFIEREFTGSEGEFFSALDADSEGEEGKFYVWKQEELRNILGKDLQFFSEIYDLEEGEWEHGNIILLRKKVTLTEQENNRLKDINKILLEIRNMRIRPGLDDKALTSWNAMMITAYVDACIATGKKKYLEAAQKNHLFISSKMKDENGWLLHSFRNGKSNIPGFLEDYAFYINAVIRLYQITFAEELLNEAVTLTHFVMKEFYDEGSNTFFFTSKNTSELIVRKPEINDNVIPSSSAVMAHCLFTLGHYYEDAEMISIAKKFASTFSPIVTDYPEGYAHWGELILNFQHPFYEVAVSGENTDDVAATLLRKVYPPMILMKIRKDSRMPLTLEKPETKDTLIYVCSNNTCQVPVNTVNDALTFLV